MSALELAQSIRNLAVPYSHLGNRTILGGSTPDLTALATPFLVFLESIVSRLAPELTSQVDTIDAIQGHPVTWQRHRIGGAFPLLVERLRIVDKLAQSDSSPDELPFRKTAPGEWSMEERALLPGPDHFSNNAEAWEAALTQILADSSVRGGLSVNTLRIPAQALASGAIDLRPTVLRAYDSEHRSADLLSAKDQSLVANAFWQTYWATGALRSERGQTFPVAFLPVERSHPKEFKPPFRERYVSLRRRLLGRTSILSYVYESLTRARALFVDLSEKRYVLKADYLPEKAEWPTTAADVALALQELERTGWLDRYTGTNKDLFATLPIATEAAPWPYGSDSQSGPKIKAGGPASDFLQSRRIPESAESAERFVRLRRVIPYAAAATLGQVFHEQADLTSRGKMPAFDSTVLAGTNSTFFLNFSEEYCGLHSVMNDPVSTLLEDGHTHHLRTLRRATFAITAEGNALITTRIGNHLCSDVLVFEGEAVTATSARGAAKPYGANRVGPLFFGAVVVGDSIVETFEESAGEIPANGWITGDSEAFGGTIEPVAAVRATLRLPGSSQETTLRHALSVGPLLVQDSKPIKFGETGEDFVPYVGPPISATETKDLARTELPPSFLKATQVGLPPTRFPHDWDLTRAPRTGLGVTPEGDVLLVVVDGRADLPHSVGVSLAELAAIMAQLGCKDAMNLDGGGSSVMYVNDPAAPSHKIRADLRDGVVGLPSDLGGVERLVPVPLLVLARNP